nr:EOG090X0CWG [Triops cancriformis]
MCDSDVHKLLEEKVLMGEKLLEQLSHDFSQVKGKDKLERKILTEIKALRKLQMGNKPIQKAHIMTTNLHYLSAVVQVLQKCTAPCAVLRTFPIDNSTESGGRAKRLEIDVLDEDGLLWYKAVARHPKALQQISKGEGGFKQRSILEQAKLYLLCAHHNETHFRIPKVIFHFTAGIGQTLARKLESLGVIVEGEMKDFEMESYSESSESDSEESVAGEGQMSSLGTTEQPPATNSVFLDITAMIAYVSSLTNGGANFRFPRPIYNQQAEWERSCPTKPQLDELFSGKQLFSCQTAVDDFSALVQQIGGPSEKQRAAMLLEKLTTVPDNPSPRMAALPVSSSIKSRARTIFGTADNLKMPCVTANTGFARSASGQGCCLSVLLHAPRVLTEQQQDLAEPL